MVIDAGYAYTGTSAYERPQGFGFYAIKPDGRAGNYFVNAHKQSRRDQIRANVLASSFEAAGLHRIKAGADIDVVHYSQEVQRTGMRTTTGTDDCSTGPHSVVPRRYQSATPKNPLTSWMPGRYGPTRQSSTVCARIGTNWCGVLYSPHVFRWLTLYSGARAPESQADMQLSTTHRVLNSSPDHSTNTR